MEAHVSGAKVGDKYLSKHGLQGKGADKEDTEQSLEKGGSHQPASSLEGRAEF